MNKFDLKVLCIESKVLFERGKWNGLQTENLDFYYDLILKHSEFKVRSPLENDPSYKQIIPQVILEHRGKYFLHKVVNADEKRLQEMYPLALGGHVDEFDSDGNQDLIQTALMRELSEEVVINSKIIEKEFLGLMYLEDGNSVNHVHVGLYYKFKLGGKDVHVIEDALEEVGFVDKEFLKNNIDKLTYWSKYIVRNLN